MRKITAICTFVLLLSAFGADAQWHHHRRGGWGNGHDRRGYNYGWRSYGYRPSFFRFMLPRIIIAAPPIILGRGRDYNRGYEQGRRDRENDRNRRYDDRNYDDRNYDDRNRNSDNRNYDDRNRNERNPNNKQDDAIYERRNENPNQQRPARKYDEEASENNNNEAAESDNDN